MLVSLGSGTKYGEGIGYIFILVFWILGVHFETSDQPGKEGMLTAIENVVSVLFHGALLFTEDEKMSNKSLISHLSVEGDTNTKWSIGPLFYE